ncbi:HAMP domain-containing histidine kinase [Amycolatopsis sp. K13G38]|uniref:histidine kinase n=2 Tax=Amycolatopsis acididurans TaxID=2724524 RepID=A0ABX1J9Z7_9PSEU|nr:HAMP domain-containing histidine kinase [Amycolatopsis acididurans]
MVAFAAYQLQASTTRDRFIAAARTSFRSDAIQAKFVAQYVPGGDSAAELVQGYMSRERGITWCLFERVPGLPANRVGDPSPVEVPEWLVDTAVDSSSPVMWEPENQPFVVFAGTTTPYVVLVEFYNMQPLEDELIALRRSLSMIAIVVATLGVGAALVAAKRLQRPVQAVADAARQLGRGALDIRVPVRGRDELAELASSFNSMAAQVGQSIAELRAKDQQQRRFVADAAHDLRTPVAAMVAAADGLDHPELGHRSAQLMGVQARRLGTLIEDLLEMSRFDAGVAEFRPDHLDLADVWRDAIELTGGEVELRTRGDLALTGDPRRLHTIARNLLANAFKHGAPPVTVTIDGTDADTVTIRVADSGPGVPEELLPLVFDRFVRGDRARSATDGSGLGLAIALENARAHGGHITVANSGGAVFTVTIPRAPHGSATDV